MNNDSFADLLPVGDVDGFVQAILRLTGDQAISEERGRNARQFAEQHLTLEKVAVQILTVYEKTLFEGVVV
jgi:glycosyltransferase involved in cell wall biosynthesis